MESYDCVKPLAIGLGLYQFVPEQQDLIKTRLQEGCNFRFVIFDVNSPHIAALDRNLVHSTVTLAAFIENCTDFFKKFQKEIEKLAPKGKLDVRVYDAVPPWGLIAIDHEHPNGRILIEFNGIQVEGSACPGAEIIPKEGGWYRFFYDQIALIWNAGKPLGAIQPAMKNG